MRHDVMFYLGTFQQVVSSFLYTFRNWFHEMGHIVMFHLGTFQQVVGGNGVTNGRTKFTSVQTEVTKMEATFALQGTF